MSRGVGSDGVGVTFGDESAVDGFEVCDAADELGALWPVYLGAELEAHALSQCVALGPQPFDLLPGEGEVGS